METQGRPGPSIPPPPPSGLPGIGVDLKVSRRLLWVGDAAYPLHNLTRVHTFVLRPKRMEAFNDFLKWTGIALAVYAVVRVANGNTSSYSSGNDGTGVLTAVVVVVIVALFVRLVKVWTAPNEHVLAVETSSASTALVTLPHPDQLRQLVGYIVNAIEHPEAEFQVRVEKVLVNPKNYHFGDTVNMYGGLFNTGVVKK